jgi:hypothetical protein
MWHVDGNFVEGYPEISASNWAGGVDYEEGTSPEKNRRKEPFEVAPVITQPAAEAYELVLKYAGCYFNRDSQEKRIIEQIRTGKYNLSKNGLIDRVEQAGGWPALNTGKIPQDTDKDGIPDEWERKNGLNAADSADAKRSAGNGYMNIENYINGLLPDIYHGL